MARRCRCRHLVATAHKKDNGRARCGRDKCRAESNVKSASSADAVRVVSLSWRLLAPRPVFVGVFVPLVMNAGRTATGLGWTGAQRPASRCATSSELSRLSGKSRKIFHATTCMPFSPPLYSQAGRQKSLRCACVGGVPAAAQDGGGIIHFIAFGLDLTGAHLIWSCPLPF